jgi:hypothetical protein
MSSTVSMKTISSVSSFSAITVNKGTHNNQNKKKQNKAVPQHGPILFYCTAVLATVDFVFG